MIGSSIVSVKLATTLLTRDMLNSDTTRRLVPNVLDSSKRWLIGKLQQHGYQRLLQRDQGERDEEEDEEAISNRLKHDAASAEYLVHHWLEAIFAWFQVIVLWHEPRVSLCAISGLLSSFLLLTYFAPRFYATIMIALFLYHLNKFWFRHVWPEIRVPPGKEREEEMRLDVDRWTYLHPQLMTLSELKMHSRDILKAIETQLLRLFELRQRRPVAFASLVCTLLSCTAFLGNRIAGLSLIFWTLTALMTAPGIYVHLLPEQTKSWLWHTITNLKLSIISYSIHHSVDSNHKEDEETDDEEEEEEEEEDEKLKRKHEKEEEEGKREQAGEQRDARTNPTTADHHHHLDQQQRQELPDQVTGQASGDDASASSSEKNLIELDGFVML